MRHLVVTVALASCGGSMSPAQTVDGPAPADAPPVVDAPPGIDACVAMTCDQLAADCGSIADGCGSSLDCGSCVGPSTCGGQQVDHVCAIPTAQRTCVAGWCFEAPAPLPYVPSAMFAVSPTDVWGVGNRGMVVHYDGTSWTLVSAGTTNDLNGIWMASSTDGWIVGNGGVIRRWNGTAWTTVASNTTADLFGVNADTANDVWMVGTAVARKWNGSALTTPVASSVPQLVDVFVGSSSNVFAVGEGQVWKYTGLSWSSQTPAAGGFAAFDLAHIRGTATHAWAIGTDIETLSSSSLLYEWNGGTWTQVSDPSGPSAYAAELVDGSTIYGVSGSFYDLDATTSVAGPYLPPVAAAGSGSALFAQDDGGQPWRDPSAPTGAWVADGYGTRLELDAIGLVGTSVYFAGENGALLEWNGGVVPRSSPTNQEILAIGGVSATDAWLADTDTVYHFDGTTWTADDSLPFVSAHAIYATADATFVFGRTIDREPAGGSWSAETVPGTPANDMNWSAYSALGSDIYAVGYDNSFPPVPYVAVRHAGGWTTLPTPSAASIVCGIVASSASDIWIAGNDGQAVDEGGSGSTGQVSHWDGSAWTTTAITGTTNLCAITVSDGALLVGGSPGDIHRRAADGTWTTESPLAAGSILGLLATPTDTWAIGSFGAVMRQ